jgi:hypothetical protein
MQAARQREIGIRKERIFTTSLLVSHLCQRRAAIISSGPSRF